MRDVDIPITEEYVNLVEHPMSGRRLRKIQNEPEPQEDDDMDVFSELFEHSLHEMARVYMMHREEKGDSWKWETCPVEYLRDKFYAEINEFRATMDGGVTEYNEIIDILNVGFMLLERLADRDTMKENCKMEQLTKKGVKWGVKILEHFQLREMRCHGEVNRVIHDCGLVILVPELLVALSSVRDLFGEPIVVTSWTRCKGHNTALEGAKRSYHMNGRAVDLRVLVGGSLKNLKQVCASVFPYTENYDYHVHCDVRGERP